MSRLLGIDGCSTEAVIRKALLVGTRHELSQRSKAYIKAAAMRVAIFYRAWCVASPFLGQWRWQLAQIDIDLVYKYPPRRELS